MQKFVVGFMVGLILGSVIVIFLMPKFGAVLAPSIHKQIAEDFQLIDTETGAILELEFIGSKDTKMLSVTPLSFVIGEKYTVSEWVWRSGGDPNAYMNIWGPGNDGESYWIEIAKTMGNPLKIVTPWGETVEDAPGQWTATMRVVEE